jgi:hypothetical protein
MKKHLRILLILVVALVAVVSLGACTTVGPPSGQTPVWNPYLATQSETTGEIPQATHEISFPFIISEVDTAVTPTLTVTPQPTATFRPATYYHFEPGVNPLTGLPVGDPSVLDRRPVLIKVSNWPREGRPHAGLSSADIVFEYFIGYNMNRFLAVYYGDNADTIGPVRSGRLVDAQLTLLYQGILGYGNADPQVDAVLVEALGDRALAFKHLPCPPMCGTVTHSATGVFADSAAMTSYAVSQEIDNTPPDLRGMFFQEEPLAGDAPGTFLRFEYASWSRTEWHYDANSGRYALWMDMETSDGVVEAPMTDRNTGAPVTVSNVVVMYAEYVEYAPTLHDIRIQDVRDYQPALLFRDGVVVYGTWRVPEPNRPIIFEFPSGDSLPFKPGRTWVIIAGVNSQTYQPSSGRWDFYFDLP